MDKRGFGSVGEGLGNCEVDGAGNNRNDKASECGEHIDPG